MSDTDLSDEIIRAIARKPGEQVTCRRVTKNFYRCNWWAQQSTSDYDNPKMLGMLVTTSRICKSQFLRAMKTGDELTITVIGTNGGEEVAAQTE